MTKYLVEADWYLMSVHNDTDGGEGTYARMAKFLHDNFGADTDERIEVHKKLLESKLWEYAYDFRFMVMIYVPVFETPKRKDK